MYILWNLTRPNQHTTHQHIGFSLMHNVATLQYLVDTQQTTIYGSHLWERLHPYNYQLTYGTPPHKLITYENYCTLAITNQHMTHYHIGSTYENY